jgi:hypothetical protein
MLAQVAAGQQGRAPVRWQQASRGPQQSLPVARSPMHMHMHMHMHMQGASSSQRCLHGAASSVHHRDAAGWPSYAQMAPPALPPVLSLDAVIRPAGFTLTNCLTH